MLGLGIYVYGLSTINRKSLIISLKLVVSESGIKAEAQPLA